MNYSFLFFKIRTLFVASRFLKISYFKVFNKFRYINLDIYLPYQKILKKQGQMSYNQNELFNLIIT